MCANFFILFPPIFTVMLKIYKDSFLLWPNSAGIREATVYRVYERNGMVWDLETEYQSMILCACVRACVRAHYSSGLTASQLSRIGVNILSECLVVNIN